jgi:hypothetical protein
MSNLFYDEMKFTEYNHKKKREDGFSFSIDRYGRWYHHEGENPGPVRKERLARLFSGAGSGFWAGKGLGIDEDGNYWISQPGQKYRVDVEDVPFLITRLEVKGAATQAQSIDLFTNFDEKIELGPKFMPEIKHNDKTGEDIFYVEVRDGLRARFSKSANDEIMMNLLEEKIQDDGKVSYYLSSRGHKHLVATMDP